MSTRSAIGFCDAGEFKLIYCHYDGYPEHVGKILVEHHNSIAAAEALTEGSQIRNFDHDGTVCRFGDGDGAAEIYVTAGEALDNGFDYVYIFSEWDNCWKCYTKDRSAKVVVEKEIPGNQPWLDEPPAIPKSLDHTMHDFITRSNAKYDGYSHATGYLNGLLLSIQDELPAATRSKVINQLNAWVKENQA